MGVTILTGSALDVLRTLPSESVQVVVTSPPYFGLRSYGTDPKVWGGNPEHHHVWDEQERGWNNRHEVARLAGLEGTEKGGDANHRAYRLRDAVCSCGAWRGELGLEPTPALFIEHLVAIFAEVKRVLRQDGVAFVNLGDSYAGSGKGPTGHNGIGDQRRRQGFIPGEGGNQNGARNRDGLGAVDGAKPKDLLLIPERFAIAMQDAGWWVRSRIAWCKLSAMPESVRDRPTSAWEHVWMFTRSRTYFWDADAVRQPATMAPQRRLTPHPIGRGPAQQNGANPVRDVPMQDAPEAGANLRNFWLLGPEPSRLEHYAGFPTELPRRCILAATSQKGACPACMKPWVRLIERTGRAIQHQNGPGTGVGRRLAAAGQHGATSALLTGLVPERITIGWAPACTCDAGDPVPCVVLDPFLGSGTTALVADQLGRHAIGIELNPEYVEMARRRIESDAPMVQEPVSVETATQVGMFEEAAS